MNLILGKKLTEEHKEKIRKASTGRKHTVDVLELLKKIKSKKVIKKDMNDNFIEVYESAKVAQEITGVNKTNISACCNKKRKHAGGFRWSFCECKCNNKA